MVEYACFLNSFTHVLDTRAMSELCGRIRATRSRMGMPIEWADACVKQQEQHTAKSACAKPRRLTVGYKPLKSPGVEVPYLRLRGR